MPIVPTTPDDLLALRPLPAGLDVRRDGDRVHFFDRSPGLLSPGGGLGGIVLMGFLGVLLGVIPGGWIISVSPWPPPAWAWGLFGIGVAVGLAVGIGVGVWLGQPESRELSIDTRSGEVKISRTDGGHSKTPLVWHGTRNQLRIIACPIRGTTPLDRRKLLRPTVFRGAAAFALLEAEDDARNAGWLLLATGDDHHALAHDLWLEAALPDAEVVDEEVIGEVNRWLFRRHRAAKA